MTDRCDSLLVILEKEMRTDDVECIVNAIGMIKNVISVTPNITDSMSYIATTKAKHEIRKKIIDVLYED